jgi:hypothetical protein
MDRLSLHTVNVTTKWEITVVILDNEANGHQLRNGENSFTQKNQIQ